MTPEFEVKMAVLTALQNSGLDEDDARRALYEMTKNGIKFSREKNVPQTGNTVDLPTNFPDKAKKIVADYFNSRDWNIRDGRELNPDAGDVYVVWFCYILGGWKALVSTNQQDDLYYEVTFNKDKNEVYLDVYEKQYNIAIPQGAWPYSEVPVRP